MITEFTFRANMYDFLNNTAYLQSIGTDRDHVTIEQFFQYIAKTITDDYGTTCNYRRWSDNNTVLLLFPTLNGSSDGIVVWYTFGYIATGSSSITTDILDQKVIVASGVSGKYLHINSSYIGLNQGGTSVYGVSNRAYADGLPYDGGEYNYYSYNYGGILYGDDFNFRLIKKGDSAYTLFASPRSRIGQTYNRLQNLRRTIGGFVCNATSKIESDTIQCVITLPSIQNNDPAQYIDIVGKDARFCKFYPFAKFDYGGNGNYNYFGLCRIAFDDYVVDNIYTIKDNDLENYIKNSISGENAHGILENNYSFIDGLIIDNDHYIFPAVESTSYAQDVSIFFDILIKST